MSINSTGPKLYAFNYKQTDNQNSSNEKANLLKRRAPDFGVRQGEYHKNNILQRKPFASEFYYFCPYLLYGKTSEDMGNGINH